MAGPKYIGFDTLSLHAGQQPDPTTGRVLRLSIKAHRLYLKTPITPLRCLMWRVPGMFTRAFPTPQ